MTSGFRVGTTDLDDWFDPYVVGAKPGLTGYTVAGVGDLRDRYAPLVYGTQAGVTEFAVAGVGDLNTLFAAKGTANYATPEDGGTFDSDAVSNQPSQTNAVLQLVFTDASHYKITDRGTTIGTYTVPAGMTRVSCTLTHTSGLAAAIANDTPSLTAIAAGTFVNLSSGANSGTPNTKSYGYTLAVHFAAASGPVVYTGASTWTLTSTLMG